MSAITELKNELERGARAYKAFENGAKALSLLEGIEQQEKDLKKSIAKLKDEEATLSYRKSSAEKEFDFAKSNAAIEAKDIVDKAKAAADVISNRVSSEIKAAKEASDKELKKASDDANAAKDAYKSYADKLAFAKAEYSELASAIADQKASMQKFLKG